MTRRSFERPLLATLLLVLVPLSLPAQRTTKRVFVSAVDAGGAPVLDLAAADFEVTENGTTRPVTRAALGSAPLRVVLLVDSSTSMGPMTLLMTAFGWGVRTSAPRNRPLRAVGGLMIAGGVIGLFWPPMQPRGSEFALTDALHIAFTTATLLFMFLEIGLGAAALGKRFRLYSIATIVTFVVFGVVTWLDAPRVAANLPTPWIGVWERINIAVYLLWVMVLAVAILRAPGAAAGRRSRPEGLEMSEVNIHGFARAGFEAVRRQLRPPA